MRNVFAILGRDLMRLLRVPVALVIAVGLMVLPATYAWVNVLGFWNPYGNTGNVKVAVANNDKGTDNALMGRLNLGKQIVASLKSNKDLGWQFTDTAGAMNDVESGAAYAAIVIPQDFSDNIGALVTGGGNRPQLEYYVNEKASPIAPKVTDTAAGTVDRQVNETFVSTVSEVVAQAVNAAAGKVDEAGGAAALAVSQTLDTAASDVKSARKVIADLNSTLTDTPKQTKQVRDALGTVRTLGSDASRDLSDVSELIGSASTSLNGFAGQASTALAGVGTNLTQISSLANGMVSGITSGITAAGGHVSGTLNSLNAVNDAIGQIIDNLDQSVGSIPGLSEQLESLATTNQSLAKLIANLDSLNTHIGDISDTAGDLGDNLDQAVQGTVSSLAGANTTLMTSSLPQLNSGLAQLSATATGLSSDLTGGSTLLDQTSTVLDQLDQAAASTLTTLKSTDDALSKVQTRLDTLSTDLKALSDANALQSLLGNVTGANGLDAAAIADFMLSPTVLDTHTMFPVNSYGSGMAPLFTSLALWAGAFMLVVIFKLETDEEGIVGMTPSQGYLGRWLFLAIIAALQGMVVTVGDLIIGVQTVNPFAFISTGVITGIVDSAIAFALATTFLHVGKALCVILIVVQIPGASGLYPIEMMPGFFRTLYPFFPFSHSITALRETIGGFYGGVWLREVGILLLFAALAFAVGLFVRPRIANVNRLFAREIADTDLIIGEPVRIRGRRYPVGQVLRALSDREEYRVAIAERAARFSAAYPRIKRWALIVGFVAPAIFTITFSLTTDTKLEALGTWGIWALVVIAFLMAVEYTRDRMDRQVELGNLSETAIHEALAEQSQAHERARRERREQAEARKQARRERRSSSHAKRDAKHNKRNERNGRHTA